jgi:tRNA threonylcarbamoyladenosine biosynthesis protein TsaE
MNPPTPTPLSSLALDLPDEAATAQLGAALAGALSPGLAIHLHGDLGAGKTALTRALLHAAGHVGKVKSPTYTLAEPYTITLGGRSVNVIHFDLYRMASPEEFLDAGFREDFNTDNICIVEWPEKADPVLPPPDLNVILRVAGHGRAVELQALSDLGLLCLDRLKNLPLPLP